MRIPNHGRTTRPWAINCWLTAWASFAGMAKPKLLFMRLIRVLTPTTLPSRSTNGPPLLPGLIAASVCR